MKLSKWHTNTYDDLILFMDIVCFVSILLLPSPTGDWSYLDILKNASATLRGNSEKTDLAQGIVGFRSMINTGDIYQD